MNPAINDLSAQAERWIHDHCPPEYVVGLSDHINRWASENQGSIVELWAPILRRFCQLSSFDYEIAACRFALSLSPDVAFFQFRLAELLKLSGDTEGLRALVENLEKFKKGFCETGFLKLTMARSDIEAADVLAQLGSHLKADPKWSAEYHQEFVQQVTDRQGLARGRAFLEEWYALYPVPILARLSFAVTAIYVGAVDLARRMFATYWQQQSGAGHPLFGPFTGQVEPFTDAVEATLLARISDAFDKCLEFEVRPELNELPEIGGTNVAFVSFLAKDFPNDIADHLLQSAILAGVNLVNYLDSALVLPISAPISDVENERRISALSEWLDENRPDVLILDCLPPIGVRGLNVGRIAALKTQYNFRLVCLMRDAHREAIDIAKAWLPICDTLLLFDPLSPIIDGPNIPFHTKAFCAPVPAWHHPFTQQFLQEGHMIFIGSVFWQPRAALLSVLLTEDFQFKAIFGHQRKLETSNTHTYAQQLGQSRASLNVSVHGEGIHLITGRVWETIAAGSLLVEQDNEATKKFLMPYRHYLPWSSISEIVHIGKFIERHPDVARKIAQEAQRFVSINYGPVKFWQGVLNHAFRQLPFDGVDLDKLQWSVIPDSGHVAQFDRLLKKFR